MAFQEIPSNKTYKQIVEQIISMVQSGELKSGDKLPGEREISQMLGASRASIREAFRSLEILGILEVRQGGGTYMTRFSIAPFLNAIAPLFLQDVDVMGDMMDFRILLEGEAVKAAAEHASDETVAGMQKALEVMAGGDTQAAEQADIDFHMSIFSATGNRVFMLAGECLSYILYISIHTSRTALTHDKAIARRWLEEHTGIFEAVRNHEPEAAQQRLRAHLTGVRKYMLSACREANHAH
jgi:GntR family transcriptional repressor for pyruvate dehydrogenase complex